MLFRKQTYDYVRIVCLKIINIFLFYSQAHSYVKPQYWHRNWKKITHTYFDIRMGYYIVKI